ncbi:hypothetical protein LCGC14_0894320 [marine sediment metagenome]|uniref:Uncharacterized protein n=1 Tax=marine sediment metagenome TaxID=412755 RepID=A0A0F9PJ08_9ZZZZ
MGFETKDLCLGDRELMQGIAAGSITDDGNLNDSQRRSARVLYNLGLIGTQPFTGSNSPTELIYLTAKGKHILNVLEEEK